MALAVAAAGNSCRVGGALSSSAPRVCYSDDGVV